MSIDPEKTYRADELVADIDSAIIDIRGEEIAFEERIAIQATEDNLTTDERAIAALQRAERFPGEHDVAHAWLRTSKSARIFNRLEDE